MEEEKQELFYQELGLRIKKARESQMIKQGELAEMVDMSRASIVNIEKGRQRPPVHLLLIISDITKTKIEEIIPSSSLLSNIDYLSLKPSWKKKIEVTSKGNDTTFEKISEFIIKESKK